MASLAEIRAKLKSQEVNRSTSNTGGDNAIYPHWNIQEGQVFPYISIQGTCTVTGLESDCPLIPAKGNLIIFLSVQKKVLLVSLSGKNLKTASCPSCIFQCG